MTARKLVPAALALLVSLVVAAPASAAFSIAAFSTSLTSSVAGAHPDLTTDLTFSTTTSGSLTFPDGNVRDLAVDLPAGLVGDPTAVPQCAQSDFSQNACPVASQIGSVKIKLLSAGFGFEPTLPVFNLEPRNRDETAEIAFSFQSLVTIHMAVSVRTDGDYGLTAHADGLSRAFGVQHVALTLWGIPGDAGHDALRTDMLLNPVGPSQVGKVAFLTNPTRCDGPLTFAATADSYQAVGTPEMATSSLPQLTGCDVAPFDPSFTLRPQSMQAGEPSSYQAVLTLPQNHNPDGQATADLRKAVVTLPAGVAISPSSAAGLDSCDDAQLHLHSTDPAVCPDGARIGDVEFDVPVLPEPIHGGIYLRQPLPGDLFRIALVADDFGVHLKLLGDVHADPTTGRLTTTFADEPQVPLTRAVLDFDGGSRAPLVNPSACGGYAVHSALTSWASSDAVVGDSPFAIDQDCGQESTFAPGFSAGTSDPTAAAHSSFHLRLTRDRGTALSSINTTLPLGLLASLKGVAHCPEAQAATGACPAASQIGSVTVGAGAGPAPVFLPQPGKAPTAVYLAGPYKGAPYSLSVMVPAQAGPYDLGTVVVRAALFIDPVTAQVTVKSDPLPTILQGIPLDLRDLRVDIDRPAFMVNPTGCAAQAVSGTVTSAAAQAVPMASRFQVADCSSLAFKPKLSLQLTGKGQSTDGKHPALSAVLRQTPGQANLKKLAVTLPLSLALDQRNAASDDLCEFEAGRQTIPDCPKSSIVGSVTARTPLLDDPLTGPVYFIKNVRIDPKSGRQIRTLPTLATVLRSGGVTIVLRATTAVVDKRLVTTFDAIPDAPVSDVTLNINGGSKSILVVSGANLCKASQVAGQAADGQNGKLSDARVTMGTPCGLGIVASSHTSASLKVTVGGIGAGKLSISGTGLVKAGRSITTATTATLSAPLTNATRRALARGHDVKVKVSVSFTPKGEGKAKKVAKQIVLHAGASVPKR
jgi:hypothetical protein